MNRLPIRDDVRVTNTIHAAAFAALGFPVRVHAKDRVSSGETQAAYIIAERSVTRPGMSMCQLRSLLDSGALQKSDPTNPLVEAVRCLRIRESLLRWVKGGEGQRLKQEMGCDRWRLVDGFARVTPDGVDVYSLSDIGVASGLIACGIELVHFDGDAGSRRYSFAPTSFLIRNDPPFLSTKAILDAFQDREWREQNPDHPTVLGWKAAGAYKRLVAMIREPGAVFLEDQYRSSGRTAELPAAASNKALDEAWNFFKH